MVDEVLSRLSPQFDRMYAREGRRSIAPEKLLRAQVVQMLYWIRSERLLMEEIAVWPQLRCWKFCVSCARDNSNPPLRNYAFDQTREVSMHT
jgi:hypothetical protein